MKDLSEAITAVRSKAPTPTKQDGLAFWNELAGRYGVSASELMAELQGPGLLARIGRDILGLSRVVSARGRPTDDDDNFQLVDFALVRRREDPAVKLGRIAREYVLSRGDHDLDERLLKARIDAKRKKLERLEGQWASLSPLAVLMIIGPPENRT
jgi:hypothetical protein